MPDPALPTNRRSGPIAPEGLPIVLGFVIASTIAGGIALWFLHQWGWPITGVGIILSAWCVWFFRDPDRKVPNDPGCVVSPADGVVCMIDQAPPPPELGLGPAVWPRVCVFMNVFDVHVNRSPVSGRIRRIAYRPGRFFNASLDKASEHNERSAMLLETVDGRSVVVVQIAGLIARRIVSRVKEGQSLARGERYGLIRFGSRVDVYFPTGTTISAVLKTRVKAGESVIARLMPLATPNAAPTQASEV